MPDTDKVITFRNMIRIEGNLPRHKIVRKVVNIIIEFEYEKKGKGIKFRYPVEEMPGGKKLYISRPGHKKNFDFKVDTEGFGLGDGKHNEVASDIREKRKRNERKFKRFMKALTSLYNCQENDVDKLVRRYRLVRGFGIGASVEVILKILKWLFIMEDIVYWDNEGRAFLFNYLRYFTLENDEDRLTEFNDRKINDPDKLKRYMEKANIEWIPYRDKE